MSQRRCRYCEQTFHRSISRGRWFATGHRVSNSVGASTGARSWGTPIPVRCGRGIACFYSFESYVAYVAEVCVGRDGAVHVHRLTAAVDCGLAVNPNGVRGMIQGGVNFALTPVLTGEITVRDAAVEQSNFHQYRVLRINQAPDIEVHIVSGAEELGGGAEELGGVEETGVPALAPAVANAIFAATEKRVRRLPIDPRMLSV